MKRDATEQPKSSTTGVRFNPKQKEQLARLMEKTGLDKAGVIRLALARLAEMEGV